MHLTPKYYINTVLQNVTASGEKGIFESICHPFSSKTATVLQGSWVTQCKNSGAFWDSSMRGCAKKGMLIR